MKVLAASHCWAMVPVATLVRRRMRALPTMAPSATWETSRTWSGVEMPNPTQMGTLVTLRSSATLGARSAGRALRSPVMPETER